MLWNNERWKNRRIGFNRGHMTGGKSIPMESRINRSLVPQRESQAFWRRRLRQQRGTPGTARCRDSCSPAPGGTCHLQALTVLPRPLWRLLQLTELWRRAILPKGVSETWLRACREVVMATAHLVLLPRKSCE